MVKHARSDIRATCTKSNKSIAHQRGKDDRVERIDTGSVDRVRLDHNHMSFHEKMQKRVHRALKVSRRHDCTHTGFMMQLSLSKLLSRLTPTNEENRC